MTIPLPDWATAVPPVSGVHAEPARAFQFTGPNIGDLATLFAQLLEAFISTVVRAITGIFIPGGLGGAVDQFASWAIDVAGFGISLLNGIFGGGGVVGDLVTFLRSLFGFLPSLIDLGDGTLIGNVLSEVEDVLDGTINVVENSITTLVHGLDGTIMSLQSLLGNFTGFLGTFQGLLDGIFGALTGGLGGVGSAVEHVVSGLTGLLNNLTGGLFGMFLGGGGLGGALFGFSDVRTATNNTASSLVALSQAIAALQAALGPQVVLVAEQNFTTLPDSTSLPGDWATTYYDRYGPLSASTYGIQGGLARWRAAGGYSPPLQSGGWQHSRWTSDTTSGDDQIICTVFGSVAASGMDNVITGRCNASGADRVEAEFKDGWLYLRCYNSDVPTLFTSMVHDQKAGSPYYLKLGVDGTARKFQVLDGNLPILTYTDGSAVSAMDADHRYAGMGSDFKDYYTLFVVDHWIEGGKVAYWSLAEPVTGGS